MKISFKVLGIFVLSIAFLFGLNTGDSSAQPLGDGMTIYFQMGGDPGGAATLPRTNGARDAAKALGVKLVEQYSGWQQELMIKQMKEALAANPDGISIMGHPGEGAFGRLVKEARSRGIVVTTGNTPLPGLQSSYGANGFGYAGVVLYEGGKITAQEMISKGGLKKGDKVLVYGLLSQGPRGESTRGMKDTLDAAGMNVDYIEITNEVNRDFTLCAPIITAYMAKNSDLKAIGTQHGGITATLPRVLKNAGKKPGDIIIGGIDLAPATITGLEEGYITAALDQQLYLQGFLPVVQIVLSKKYGFAGLTTNTGAGVVTPETIGALVPLIKAGIR